MPRDQRLRHVSKQTPAINKTEELVDHLTHKLCKEDIFPKRSRWVVAGKIADLMNDFETCVHLANEIKVKSQQERDDRHRYLTLAIAHLMALDAKVNRAQRSLDIPVDKLHHYATLANDCRTLLMAWLASDERRYGSPSEPFISEGNGH